MGSLEKEREREREGLVENYSSVSKSQKIITR